MTHLKIIVIIVVTLIWNVISNIFKPGWMHQLKLLKKKKKIIINTPQNSKVYWSLLKMFLNNKKIGIIPLLFYKNRFIADFK